jgi:hypothetical protein
VLITGENINKVNGAFPHHFSPYPHRIKELNMIFHISTLFFFLVFVLLL